MSRYVHISHFLNPLICWWASKLGLCLSATLLLITVEGGTILRVRDLDSVKAVIFLVTPGSVSSPLRGGKRTMALVLSNSSPYTGLQYPLLLQLKVLCALINCKESSNKLMGERIHQLKTAKCPEKAIYQRNINGQTINVTAA